MTFCELASEVTQTCFYCIFFVTNKSLRLDWKGEDIDPTSWRKGTNIFYDVFKATTVGVHSCNLISWSSRVFSFFNYSQLGYGTLLSGSIP